MTKLEFEIVSSCLRSTVSLTVDNEFCKLRNTWETITEKNVVTRTLRFEDFLMSLCVVGLGVKEFCCSFYKALVRQGGDCRG